MAGLLYPEKKRLSQKNFLREHVSKIRSTQNDNRKKLTEVCLPNYLLSFSQENEGRINAQRLRESLLKNTMSRFDKPRKNPETPSIENKCDLKKTQIVHSDFGKVPAYIKQFEADKIEEARRKQDKDEASKIPKGCRYMSNEERLLALEDVRKNRSVLIDEMKSMPLTLTTLKQRRRKIEIDLKLCELDKLFGKLEKNCVLIKE